MFIYKRKAGENKRFKEFFILLLLFLSIGNLFAVEGILGPRRNLFKIDGIDVQGIKKVEKEAILEKVHSRKGLKLTNYLLRKDIQRIYSLKYFESVEAHREKRSGKNFLIFKVKEKPIVSEIEIKGNSEIDKDDILDQMKTIEFSILDINTLKDDVVSIQKFYEEKGFYLASITYDLKKVNKENIKLTLRVREYDKVRVKKIILLGNKNLTDKEIKAAMETREENFFSFMSGAGNFKEFNFKTDIERIKFFYRNKGFLQVNIGNPEVTVSEDKKWMFITLRIVEGLSFSINEISFQGEVLFDENDLKNGLILKEGTVYSELSLRKDIQKLTEMYQDKGYAFANVLRTLHITPGENKLNVEFSFEKGKPAYFGLITIKGNNKTRDKVIRRELRFLEGERFSGSALRRSKENVSRLGFFEPQSVIFNTIPSEEADDILNVEILVKERNTGQISFGAGYSTAKGEFLKASIAQTNFLGLGQNLGFSLSWAEENKTYNIDFTEPYLFDTQWTAGFNLFRQKNESSDSFNYKRQGGALRVGYPIFDYTRLFLTYKVEDTHIRAVNDPTVDEELENGTSLSLKSSLNLDKRDNRMEPRNGFYTALSSEYSGLGGDKKWWKNDFVIHYFKNFYEDFVFRSRWYVAKLQRIERQRIPRTEKFTLGGPRNLRGFGLESIGPKTSSTKDDITQTFNAGALFSSFTNLEIEYPLVREAGLKWVLFMDAGDAGEINNFNVHLDWGFGFRWFSPIGVLRFEFGYPINYKSSNPGSQFHFDIGQLF